MEIVAGVVAAIVVLGAVGLGMRRRRTDERHSVDGYRHAIETLQTIRTKQGGTVRVLDDAPARRPGAPAAGRGADAVASEASGPTPAARRGTDASGQIPLSRTTLRGPAPGTVNGRPGAGDVGGRHRAGSGDGEGVADAIERLGGYVPRAEHRRKSRAMSRMDRRPRRLIAPIAAAVVVVVLVAVLLVVGARTPHSHGARAGGGSGHGHPAGASGPGGAKSGSQGSQTHGSQTHGSQPPTTAPHHHGSHHGSGSSGPTKTTVPASFAPAASTATSATYSMAAATYTVVVQVPSGRCWVEVRDASGGTLFAQTLDAGQQQSVPASGTTTVLLGAPSAAQVTVDGKPVVLPQSYQTPFTMTLQAPG